MTLYWRRPASWCLEGRLPFVAIPDSDVVKSSPEVELGKNLGLAPGRQCLGDQGDGVLVLGRSPVEFSVVDYQPKFSLLAASAFSAGFDKEDWCTVRGG